MGIGEHIAGDWNAALAALAWQVDMGVDEVIGDVPIDRYELPETTKPAPQPARAEAVVAMPVAAPQVDAEAAARALAARANTLEELRAALTGFDLCELKKGARNTVFADGNPEAKVLILSEAPNLEEDREGRPFVQTEGQLLDQMFAAIGLARHAPAPETALYVTHAMPWRPPQDREPTAAEIAMMRPFVDRHIALIDPAVIVVMGNTPLQMLTGQKGIVRARGTWVTALDRPLLPMVHPAYLLRNPIAKREAWADLLALQAHLRRR